MPFGSVGGGLLLRDTFLIRKGLAMNYSVSLVSLREVGGMNFKLYRRACSLALISLSFSLSTAEATGLLGGGLDVGVELGVGGSDGVNADVGVGLGGSSDVSVGAGANVGGVTHNGLGIGVGVDVSLGGSGGGAGHGPGGAPGAGPVDPSVVSEDPATIAKGRRMLASLKCATGGNTDVLNGFAVMARGGQMVGWVHNATITPDRTIAQVQMQTVKNTCVNLNGGSYAVQGSEVWVNMDEARFR